DSLDDALHPDGGPDCVGHGRERCHAPPLWSPSIVTSNSTVTSSRSLSAPKKPEYGVTPKSVCLIVVMPRYRPGPWLVTSSRMPRDTPCMVSVPAITPAAGEPADDAGDRVIWCEVKSASALAPPVPSRTVSEPRPRSAVTVASATPPPASPGVVTCASQSVISRVRSWPARAASPSRPVLTSTRPDSGPSWYVPAPCVPVLSAMAPR